MIHYFLINYTNPRNLLLHLIRKGNFMYSVNEYQREYISQLFLPTMIMLFIKYTWSTTDGYKHKNMYNTFINIKRYYNPQIPYHEKKEDWNTQYICKDPISIKFSIPNEKKTSFLPQGICLCIWNNSGLPSLLK